jgi:hypothetical protein
MCFLPFVAGMKERRPDGAKEAIPRGGARLPFAHQHVAGLHMCAEAVARSNLKIIYKALG